MTRQIEWIEWVDSFTPTQDDSWREVEELVELIEGEDVTITTLGTVIFENDTLLAIAGSYHTDRACGVMVIPKVCITARRDVA